MDSDEFKWIQNLGAKMISKISITCGNFTLQEYSDHMSLSTAHLETVALMLQVLDHSDGGPAPTE